MSQKNSIKATVFIPVYNGENDHLEDTLTALFSQSTTFNWNVLIIDSGSSDRSVDIINKFKKDNKNIIFKQIPNEEYSHGGTRQKAAEISEGEIMVYLSQDAIPANDRWLSEMVRPFSISSKIVGVLGRQSPRPTCFPLQKYDIINVFNQQGVNDAITLYDRYSANQGSAMFYSDVCSAARRENLLEDIPYRNISYAEDQAFGQDIIKKGYIKAYVGQGVVIHSNDISLREYKNRIYDENIGLEKTGIILNNPKLRDLVKALTKDSIKDIILTIKDKEYSFKRKIYFILTAPIFRYNRWKGAKMAFMKNGISLESIRKKDA